MRIIAGRFKGHRLKTPPGEGTRPTSDRVRESLFSSLTTLDVLTDTHVLDVCAGSGGLGFEALSRGAAHVTFIERAASVCRVITANARSLRAAGEVEIIQAPAASGAARLPEASIDVVFADPPYPMPEAEVTAILDACVPLLRDAAALIVLERSSRSPEPTLPERLEIFRHKKAGETALWFLQLRD
ncbi:16S rRNA (guanine(966)-N(2))-methyltransferase RsmD [Brevibacterium luteolum]|uniref:16S rRNA (guanine(966)-N(2))-methyltransferase RsmD n=1 Tax=Brevibacterium luteolum TaxID=199591 RepID=UPI001C23414B|nr:16S rRNA (guanine(966)-N(2))-methyltransferase RsmD [Brevibacterium luteolum]MBU8579344.1 16S rRNA (guanine(966)-N(2))-methyltransferase RsmD [Brevibacterium luteolum]